jgi:hypothetical protein
MAQPGRTVAGHARRPCRAPRSGQRAVRPHDHRAVPARGAASGVHDTRLPPARLVPARGGLDDDLLPRRRAADAALRRRQPPRAGLDQRPASRSSTRAATVRSRSTSPATWTARAMEIVVQAEDDPHDMHKVRGKMDWELEPHRSGIRAPPASGARCGWKRWRARTWRSCAGRPTCSPGRSASMPTSPTMPPAAPSTSRCAWASGAGVGPLPADRRPAVAHVPAARPGIDDARAHWMWSPESPQLIDAEITLHAPDGLVLDT